MRADDGQWAAIGVAWFLARLNGLPLPMTFEWTMHYSEDGGRETKQQLTVFPTEALLPCPVVAR